MKSNFLVIGCGSIGRRHLRNLKTLGVKNLFAYDPSPQNLALAKEETDAEIFDELAIAFKAGIDVCFVCSPSSFHLEHALTAARAGCHVFIEKPLSHDQIGIDKLKTEVENRKLISLVGCNMRFHPGPKKVKELLSSGAIGKILFSRVHSGSYLPDWRPATDYRQSYSGIKDLGGGAILDCIHEIDLAFWYAGAASEVFSVAERLSLDIQTEDTAFLLLRHLNGVLSEIHLDYVQRTYERGCQIVGETGTIFWDFREQKLRLYRAAEKVWETFPQPETWEINQMYIDEIRHFLDCLENGTETICPVVQAAEVLQIALAAKESSETRSFVKLN